MDRQQIGAWGEECAMRHLHDQGYVVLARNWRAPEGEVDLVAQVGETIVFVEVKTRTTHEYGWPEDSITGAKRRRLQQVACSYLQAHDLLDASWRIDVIAIDRTSSGDVGRLEHYVDAIDGEPNLL